MEAWRQWLLGGRKLFSATNNKTHYEPRIPLTPTGLLMEGGYTQMYGPAPDCKGFEVGRRDSLRKCIRPLSGESLSGHLMMIRTCRSFKIPRSPGTRLSVQVFRYAVGLFFRLLLSRADLGGIESNVRRRGGGKVESVLCFPSVASFPRPSSG